MVSPLDVLRVTNPRWRERAQEADAAAIDRGETRTIPCRYRGLYGDYPRNFRGCWLDLTPAGPVRRWYLLPFVARLAPITERITSATLRAAGSPQEAWSIGADGWYAPGGALHLAGADIVRCQTTEGILEFAVKPTDVPLLLHYIDVLRQRRANVLPQSAQDSGQPRWKAARRISSSGRGRPDRFQLGPTPGEGDWRSMPGSSMAQFGEPGLVRLPWLIAG